MRNRARTRAVWMLVVATSMCAPSVWAQEAQVEIVAGRFDPGREQLQRRELSRQLSLSEHGFLPDGFRLQLDASETRRLAEAPVEGRLLVGVVKPLYAPVRFAELAPSALSVSGAGCRETDFAGGVFHRDRDGFAWATAIESTGATAVRLQLVDVSLPEGAELFVYNRKGHAFGPYTAENVVEGELWTNTVLGDEIRVQVRYDGADPERVARATHFDVAKVVHLGHRYAIGVNQTPPDGDGGVAPDAFCSFNASCVQNASCSSMPSAIQTARNGVAHLQFVVGSSAFICSGGLLNDTDGSTSIPYLLTANHCFGSSSAASSLEAFFQFSASCGGACFNPDGAVPSVLGSSLLATSATADYTLVQLNGAAPAGSTFLGWTSTAVANTNGTALYRVSHPSGAPQAYSSHSVDTGAPTCGGVPRGSWIYSRDTFGATEGGSSGSPVMNVNGQVVGQLTGACGTNTGNPCDSTNNATIDGALASYFSSVDQWLDPTPGSCHVGSNGNASYCSTSCTCAAGEGDCDSNAECDSGLTCVNDVGPNYGFASWVDVCEPADCHPDVLGGANYCTSSCPCESGEGDCDSDAQCDSGLTCVDNVGPSYGFASWVDVCEPADCHPDVLGGADYCTASCPCAAGEGDCDGDSQCDPGLTCVNDVGPNYGFASWVDVCEAPSNPNSCVGNCGSQAPGGCWCDSQCASFGDCCSDKVAVCGP